MRLLGIDHFSRKGSSLPGFRTLVIFLFGEMEQARLLAAVR